MTQYTAPCALRSLRKPGYRWKKTSEHDRLESWALESLGELDHCCVYWNGDGHDVRVTIRTTMVAERSVDCFRGPTVKAVKARAQNIMAEFRGVAERRLIEDLYWDLLRGGGGDSRHRRKARRWAARCIAAARAEARKVNP